MITLTPSGGDDGAAINAAFATTKSVILDSGDYSITTKIVVPVQGVLRGQGRSTKIAKSANIDMVDLNDQGSLYDMILNGHGDVYTGRGVVFPSGTNYQRMVNTHVDSNGYCVEMVGQDTGSNCEIQDCFITRSPNLQAFSIKLPDLDVSGGNRTLRNIRASGGYGVDLGGAHNTALERCNMARIAMNANCITVQIQNCRLGYVEFRGRLHWVAFNNVALQSYVTADCYQSLFMWSPVSQPLGRQDPTSNGNIIW